MTQPNSPSRLSSSLGDRLFSWLCQSSGLFVLAIFVALVGILTYQAWPALKQFNELRILTSDDWDPNPAGTEDQEEEPTPSFGALLYVYGTLVTSAIAMLVAVPLGVGAAAYLSEISDPRVRKVCSFLLELLAAIPSVIFGFWAVEFLAKKGLDPTYKFFGLKSQASGEGIVAAGLVLAVMILPYITALSYDVCQAVPRSQREGALSLGATRWQTIWKVVLPYARPGIIAACFLALGRAIGETMAVTMVIGNAQHLNFSITATGDSIPSAIAKQLHETSNDGTLHRPVLIALGLVLLGITLITNVLARWLIRWASKPRVRHGRTIRVTEAPVDPVVDAARLAKARRRAARMDRFMTGVLTVCQLLTVIPLFLILGYITYKGAGQVTTAFFTNMPQDSPPGLKHALVGSVILVGLAALAAIPVGITCAILLSEYRNSPLVVPVRFITELLGGVPSIIIGVFGFALLVFPFWLKPGQDPWGYSAWAGAFALAVMMLPVVIRSAEESMRLVPGSLREASYALGASRRQTVLKVIIPAALPAIITGILLAIGRIAGETAPLILTARGSQFMPHSLSDATPSLPYYVYDYATQPSEAKKNLAWAGAFVLVCIVLILNVSVRLLAGKRVVAAARAD
jgi:phosphate transport system permease protein